MTDTTGRLIRLPHPQKIIMCPGVLNTQHLYKEHAGDEIEAAMEMNRSIIDYIYTVHM